MTLGLLLVGHSEVAAISELAVVAEDLGFTHVWVADERFYREVYSLLAVIALRTRKIALGPCVTDPYSRHPALTAAAIHTLDEISGQRAVLGIGAGVSGFAEMGVPRPKPTRAIREAVELVRALSRGEDVTYEGEVIRFTDGRLGFKPIRSDIPVWIASNGPLGQRMAAEVGDAVIMESCGNAIEANEFRNHVNSATAAGRSVKCIARLNLSISDIRSEAMDALRLRTARSLGSGRTKFYTLETQGFALPEHILAEVAHIPYNAGAAPFEIIRDAISDAMVGAVALGGTPEDLKAQLRALFSAGINGVIVSVLPAKGHTVRSTLERFVNEVWQPVVSTQPGNFS